MNLNKQSLSFNKKDLIIGVGGAGKNMIENNFMNHPNYNYLIYHSENISDCHNHLNNAIKPEYIHINSRDKLVNKNTFRLSDITIEKLSRLLLSHRKISLLAGIGGLTGTQMCKQIILLSKTLNIELSLIAFLPFFFEKERRIISVEALDHLKLMGINIQIIDHEIESKKVDSNINFEDYLNYANDMAFSMVINHLNSSTINRQPAECQKYD